MSVQPVLKGIHCRCADNFRWQFVPGVHTSAVERVFVNSSFAISGFDGMDLVIMSSAGSASWSERGWQYAAVIFMKMLIGLNHVGDTQVWVSSVSRVFLGRRVY